MVGYNSTAVDVFMPVLATNSIFLVNKKCSVFYLLHAFKANLVLVGRGNFKGNV